MNYPRLQPGVYWYTPAISSEGAEYMNIKPFQGFKSWVSLLPPVAPEVIHIGLFQSHLSYSLMCKIFLWRLGMTHWNCGVKDLRKRAGINKNIK
jgi:hypothetical protein